MNHLIIDTDVVLYFYADRPEAGKYEPYIRHTRPVLTFATIAELHLNARHDEWSEDRIAHLDDYLRRRFSVLPFDTELPRLWARLHDHATRTGHPLAHGPNDLWTAACAIHYDAPLLTGSARQFHALPGLSLITTDD